jgi:hypothetical protein
MRFFWKRNPNRKESTEQPRDGPSPDGEVGSPYAGSWEGSWEGAGARWLYATGGQAWLRVDTDGEVAAQISTSGSGVSRWRGEIAETGDIHLEEVADTEAFGSAHGEVKLVRRDEMRISVLIGGIAPTPFEAEFDLTRRTG